MASADEDEEVDDGDADVEESSEELEDRLSVLDLLDFFDPTDRCDLTSGEEGGGVLVKG